MIRTGEKTVIGLSRAGGKDVAAASTRTAAAFTIANATKRNVDERHCAHGLGPLDIGSRSLARRVHAA
jgi:hypothetical protein